MLNRSKKTILIVPNTLNLHNQELLVFKMTEHFFKLNSRQKQIFYLITLQLINYIVGRIITKQCFFKKKLTKQKFYFSN